jgi:hypothetical protein
MSWTTPCTDRALSDITNRTSKGFFNVINWARIDFNSTAIRDAMDAAGYAAGALVVLTPPNTATIPTAAGINQLIENIERLRVVCCLPAACGLVVLPYNWIGGANSTAPDYEDVNAWENNQKIIYESIPKVVDYWIACGVSATGQTRFWQNKFR